MGRLLTTARRSCGPPRGLASIVLALSPRSRGAGNSYRLVRQRLPGRFWGAVYAAASAAQKAGVKLVDWPAPQAALVLPAARRPPCPPPGQRHQRFLRWSGAESVCGNSGTCTAGDAVVWYVSSPESAIQSPWVGRRPTCRRVPRSDRHSTLTSCVPHPERKTRMLLPETPP